MEKSPEHSKSMSQETVSIGSLSASGQAIDLNVHSDGENAGLPAPPTVDPTTKRETIRLLAQNLANDEGNESNTDIIILPPPSTKQESAEHSEIIQTDFITIPFPEAKTARVQVISSEIIVPSSDQNVVEKDHIPIAETCSGTVLKSSQIASDVMQEDPQRLPPTGDKNASDVMQQDQQPLPPTGVKIASDVMQRDLQPLPANGVMITSDVMQEDVEPLPPSGVKVVSDVMQGDEQPLPANGVMITSDVMQQDLQPFPPTGDKNASNVIQEDQQPLQPTGVITRSSSRKKNIDTNCSTIAFNNFKVPYPVRTTVVIEEMDTEQNDSTLSADTSLLDNTDGSNESEGASQNAQDMEDSLLVEQYSENVNIDEPKGSLYVEDKGPRMYEVPQNLTSKPLNPTHLPYVFKDLPVFGRPRNKAELPEFYRNKIKQFVGSGLDDEEFDNLAAYCCPDNLRTGNELTMQSSPGQGFFPSELDNLSLKNKELSSSHNLNTVRKLKLRVERDTKNLYSKRYKYRGVRMIPLNNDDEDNTPVVTIGQPIIPGKELLFVIRWYRPFPYNPKDRFGYRSRHSVFSSNIVMLGRHKLSLLRDRVVCPNDVDMRVDVSDHPDELPRSSAKELFPSGFLFINNVFYVDKRQGCVDYTAALRRWAKTRGIGDFPCKDMSEVRLDELVVKLGHPEVYVHQGNCEHLFTISEVRLVSAADPRRLAAYPAHTMLSQHQTIYCTTCAEFGAKWIVVGCPRVPFDPAFFCEKCFKLYLYKDGQKIGNFKAYLYRGNEINALKPQG